MISAGIVGGSGYTAGELLHLLLNHPQVEIDFIYSTSRPGEPVVNIHQDLIGETDLVFSSEINPEVDILFLCTGHGNSTKVLQTHAVSMQTKLVDLSRDFRLTESNTINGRTFTYGLPELQKDAISEAANIANPGCFATAIQLALLPLAKESLLGNDVHVHGITGSTGAGSSLSETTHFTWRSNNVSIYKALDHQHINEVQQSLSQESGYPSGGIHFIPVRGNFARGIFITAYTPCSLSPDEVQACYADYYNDAPFVHLSSESLYLKQVVNTNKCLLHLQKKGGQLLVTSTIDNLLKGAAGQAVQNMNLMFGLDETAGLHLKPIHF